MRSSLLWGWNKKSWWYLTSVDAPGCLALIFELLNSTFGPINWVAASRARLSRMTAR